MCILSRMINKKGFQNLFREVIFQVFLVVYIRSLLFWVAVQHRFICYQYFGTEHTSMTHLQESCSSRKVFLLGQPMPCSNLEGWWSLCGNSGWVFMTGLRKTKIKISTADFTSPTSKTLLYSLPRGNIISDTLFIGYLKHHGGVLTIEWLSTLHTEQNWITYLMQNIQCHNNPWNLRAEQSKDSRQLCFTPKQ